METRIPAGSDDNPRRNNSWQKLLSLEKEGWVEWSHVYEQGKSFLGKIIALLRTM